MKRPRATTPRLRKQDVEDLQQIALALSAEHDLKTLLEKILSTSRRLLKADAGSIFLVEQPTHDMAPHLRCRLAQNDSLPIHLEDFLIPFDESSLVGHVAKTRKSLRFSDVYNIPASLPFRFYPDVDRTTGYRSKSVLSVPMVDHQDQLIGVVQLWNKKKDPKIHVTSKNLSQVVGFTESDQKVLASLASQAAVAVENAQLYEEIRSLFKKFVRASVLAIEARDPTTFGHSERVATLSVGLAKEVHQINAGCLSCVSFTEHEFQEIEYAALLHDFGKIGVKESVLLKAKKLYPQEWEIIQGRLDLLVVSAQLFCAQKQCQHLSKGGTQGDEAWTRFQEDLAETMAWTAQARSWIAAANEPSITTEEQVTKLSSLIRRFVTRPNGAAIPILSTDQLNRLLISKGSLSQEERSVVEEHVQHTYQFLKQIPWTKDLQHIPHIAYSHHEKLDGSGYPRKIQDREIPIAAKIMAIADVFDALTAEDRAYKGAVSIEMALDTLRHEAADQKLDSELVNLFIKKKVFLLTTRQ